MAYKRILVPVDGGATSMRGLGEALRLVKENKARLCLLHIVEEYALLTAPEMGAAFVPMVESMRAGGRKTLDRIADRINIPGVKPERVLVEDFSGRVADAIVKQAKKWRADLVVMGTHGRRGVQRALLGSDAELVLRYSPVPVLLVPARERKG